MIGYEWGSRIAKMIGYEWGSRMIGYEWVEARNIFAQYYHPKKYRNSLT